MSKATHTFTLPSVEDETTLECRIYHAKSILPCTGAKGAVVAHPYAPLGGCYDDMVILNTTETLLTRGYVVGTFNFRGAGGSHGRTSWTGRGEIEDYTSVAGFLIYYLQHMNSHTNEGKDGIEFVLCGYSYGALVLARLPSVEAMTKRFQDAPLGTAAAEVIIRARILAKHTLQTTQDVQCPINPRERTSNPTETTTSPAQSPRASAMLTGGEESDSSNQRRSRDSRRSADVVRSTMDVHRRIGILLRKHSDKSDKSKHETNPSIDDGLTPVVRVRYLLISPVLLPFTSILCPPGPPASMFRPRGILADGNAGSLFLQRPTLILFGSSDGFTSGRRLRAWAEKYARTSGASDFRWEQINSAGHFWREDGVMAALQSRVSAWVTPVSPPE